MFSYMAKYCDTPQSKEGRNREYKACLNERAILRLLDVCQAKLVQTSWTIQPGQRLTTRPELNSEHKELTNCAKSEER